MSRLSLDPAMIQAVVFDVDGVLSPATVPMDSDGQPVRMVNIKDGFAIQHAAKCGIKMAVITGANTPALINRYSMLGVKDVFIGASRKLLVLQKWLADNNIDPSKTAFCGDDLPDIPCMEAVGLAVAPADAADEVLAMADYITVANGGYGVARELLQQILRAKDCWTQHHSAFGW